MFLGFTFCFAGLQKLANPNFFNANNPSGIYAQLVAAERFSPLHPILGHLLKVASPLGVFIALGELAVGIGTLLGLWTRIAAIGGALISLSLFLTVTWQVSPYYTGADLAYLMAWVPLIIAGSGGVLSLDAAVATRARRDAGQDSPETVPITFSVVQQVCGHYAAGRCEARGGDPCQSHGCPFLLEHRLTDIRHPGAVERRTLVLGGAAVAGAGLVGAAIAGTVAGVGKAAGSAKALPPGERTLSASGGGSSSSGSTGAGAGSGSAGSSVGSTNEVPVGGAAAFTDPGSGDPAIMLQLTKGHFVAYNAVCPHAGCTVGYSTAAQILVCPCHGSEFNPVSGGLLQGPATRGLQSIPVEVSDGQLFVDG